MNTAFDAILAAPFGALGVRCGETGLLRLQFLPADTPLRCGASPLLREVVWQLAAYLANPHHRFDLPLEVGGTVFRRRVWSALLDIPVGERITYAELARRIGSGARAVGQALGDNPLPIVLPCHRVVARRGLGGFDHGRCDIDVKRWLLDHEGAL